MAGVTRSRWSRRAALAAAAGAAGLGAPACGATGTGRTTSPGPAIGGVPDRPVTLVFLDMGTGAPGLLFSRAQETFRERHPRLLSSTCRATPAWAT
jgi:hypothetical protein